MEEKANKLLDSIIFYLPYLVGAIIVLVVGLLVIRLLTRSLGRFMDKKEVDPSLKPFLRSAFNIILKVLLIVSIMAMVGIEMASFIAIIGAAGLAVGLALSGTLQNFAGGVMILLFKPFKVGEYIEAQGYSGTVNEIQIFNTILKTPDNRVIIIPNGGLATSSLVNYSRENTRRVEWTFGIAYGDDTSKARSILEDIIAEDQRILDEPAPFIALNELADSSVNYVVRVWANSSDFWSVYFEMNQKVYDAFNAQGINIPFPQMDIHLQKD